MSSFENVSRRKFVELFGAGTVAVSGLALGACGGANNGGSSGASTSAGSAEASASASGSGSRAVIFPRDGAFFRWCLAA